MTRHQQLLSDLWQFRMNNCKVLRPERDKYGEQIWLCPHCGHEQIEGDKQKRHSPQCIISELDAIIDRHVAMDLTSEKK